LGKVYYTLGDCERATDLLQQVMDQYPGKTAAKLAENYLRESVNCDN
jgi:TolA-binding protein